MRRQNRHIAYGAPPRRRTKKIRPLIRVKERIAKKGGRCAACKSRYEAGAEVTVVNVKRRTYHRHGCVPANATVGVVGGTSTVANTPDGVVGALSATWAVGEAKLVAVMALENAMVVIAKNNPVTPEMEKSFDRFMKVKAMALRPGSDQEGKQATRLALIEIVKTFF